MPPHHIDLAPKTQVIHRSNDSDKLPKKVVFSRVTCSGAHDLKQMTSTETEGRGLDNRWDAKVWQRKDLCVT